MRFGGDSLAQFGGFGGGPVGIAAITGGTITGITDLAVADGGTGASTGIDAGKNLGHGYILAQSFVAVSGPGDTLENILATINVPANAMGPNGSLRIRTNWSMTNNGNTKTGRIRFSGIGGTQFFAGILTSQQILQDDRFIGNANATNSQVGPHPLTNCFTLNGSQAIVTAAVDTTLATTLVITGQKATAGDTLTLNFYIVEVLYGA